MDTEIITADSRRLRLQERYDKILYSLPLRDKERVLSYMRQEDRLRCAVGAYLTIYAVSRALNCGRDDFHIVRTEYGKPYVQEYPDIHFSLSHSEDMIVFAGADREIGVDIEIIKDIDIPLYSHIFTENERGRIARASRPLDEFYRIWTAREAFSKMVGTGLTLFENEKIGIDHEHGTVLYKSERSSVRTFSTRGYMLSVCIKGDMQYSEPRFITAQELCGSLDP